MDFSLVSAAITSIKTAKDIAGSALAVRDWNLVATEIAKMNDQLLKAQDALFSHNSQLLELQQQLFETTEKLRKAEESIAERGRYSLVDVGGGQWAYRVNVSPVQGGSGEPSASQFPHYVCQPCFDNGRKVVLQLGDAMGYKHLWCPVCKTTVSAGNIKC